ncbi:MAG: hypothetical protein PHO37_14135 [Kiritimatiellae bacterium]|nr:hypothetical protein [Kiritimatiellia bacterium]
MRWMVAKYIRRYAVDGCEVYPLICPAGLVNNAMRCIEKMEVLSFAPFAPFAPFCGYSFFPLLRYV